MTTLAAIRKQHHEAGAVNALVNLFAFTDDQVFLTKSGEVGMVLKVQGRDYECLDPEELEDITKKFESFLRSFDSHFRIYQYLLKRSGPRIPHRDDYLSPVVRDAVERRTEYLEANTELYTIEVYFVILYEGSRHSKSLVQKLQLVLRHPAKVGELFSINQAVVILSDELNRARALLVNKVQSFVIQLNDFVPLSIADYPEALLPYRRLLNLTPYKADAEAPKRKTFLDIAVCGSEIDAYRDHLKIDDYFVKILTLKDPPSATDPNMLRHLQELPSQAIIVSEFQRVDSDKMRKLINSKRRHFHNAKVSILSYLSDNSQPKQAHEVLVDDSASAVVGELGQALTGMEQDGLYYGFFNFTVLLYDTDQHRLNQSVAEAFKVFASRDAVLFEERYNLLNAFFGALPGNHRYSQIRQMYLANRNYADLSFLFVPQSGEPWNAHLNDEYLLALETKQRTPYYLNLHYQDVGHTLMVGMTGSGKTFTLKLLVTHAMKSARRMVIFDLGGSYRDITARFGGSYMQIGIGKMPFTTNLFSLPRNQENLHFQFSFIVVLLESSGDCKLTDRDRTEIHEAVESMYTLDPEARRLRHLMIPSHLTKHMAKWLEGGQYGNLFDNVEDTLTFADFQTFDFQGMDKYPEIMQPLLFYILHRANASIYDPALRDQFKMFVMDECWKFLAHPTLREYVGEHFKTGRKHKHAMVLATQSLSDFSKNKLLEDVIENAATLILLANPRMDQDEYRRILKLNKTEAAVAAGLLPKNDLFIKRPDVAKVARLNVSAADHRLYASTPPKELTV